METEIRDTKLGTVAKTSGLWYTENFSWNVVNIEKRMSIRYKKNKSKGDCMEASVWKRCQGDVKVTCLDGRKNCPYNRYSCKFRGMDGLGRKL